MIFINPGWAMAMAKVMPINMGTAMDRMVAMDIIVMRRESKMFFLINVFNHY